MQAELVSVPGDPARPNEDWAGIGGDALVVVDGAGSPPDLGTGCLHGVAWYARTLGAVLLNEAQCSRHTLVDVLGTGIEIVANRHASECDLSHPGTPSAAVSVVRCGEGAVEYVVLADCTVVIGIGDDAIAITDRREAVVGAAFKFDGMWTDIGSDAHRAQITAYMDNMRSMRNISGGFWVAAADSAVAAESVSGSIERDRAAVAVMSDGASRPFDLFDMDTPASFLRRVVARGARLEVDGIRTNESTDPHGARWPRAKRHDDASLLVSCP